MTKQQRKQEAHHALRILLRTYKKVNVHENPEYMVVVYAVNELERLYAIEMELEVLIEQFYETGEMPMGVFCWLANALSIEKKDN